MWDLIVSVPDDCLSFYFKNKQYRQIILDDFEKWSFFISELFALN